VLNAALLKPGLRKTHFLFFKKKGSSFIEENTKTQSELFLLHYAISPFLELHNNSLL